MAGVNILNRPSSNRTQLIASHLRDTMCRLNEISKYGIRGKECEYDVGLIEVKHQTSILKKAVMKERRSRIT